MDVKRGALVACVDLREVDADDFPGHVVTRFLADHAGQRALVDHAQRDKETRQFDAAIG